MKWKKANPDLYIGYFEGVSVARIEKHQQARNGYGRWSGLVVVDSFWLVVDEETGNRTTFKRLKEAKAYVQSRWEIPGE